MKYRSASLLLTMCVIGVCVYAQSATEPVTTTTVCEIVRHPEQFERKRGQVRAQIWLYSKNYWLNEFLAEALQFGQSCGWLSARFTDPPTLVSDVAFGTFTGTVVREPGSLGKKVRMRFLIERQEEFMIERTASKTDRCYRGVRFCTTNPAAPSLSFPSKVIRANNHLA